MKKWLFVLLFLTVVSFIGCPPLHAEEEYYRGAILDPVLYAQVDAKPVLLSRSYTALPRSVSLRQYSPIPESQGIFSTCVGWASAFAARTISESVAINRRNQEQSSNSAFSPIYIYKNISSDPSGKAGTSISKALDFMKKSGAVKRLSAEKTTDFANVSISMYANTRHYTISDYSRLRDILAVKKSLSEGKPVIIGMNTPDSFFRAKGVWQPSEDPQKLYGGHALCVVGYNDDMHGGAFEVQNSWGTQWGDGGYIWIKYSDFAAFALEAYAIVENLANYKDNARFAASIAIEMYNSSAGMPVSFDRQGFYKTRASYPSRTEFRFLMTNRYPAYVYAFSADNYSPGATRIFPQRGVSPVMDYPDSTIAWPGEYDWIRMDDVAGTDYLVVLYSKEALDIAAIERRFANEKGAFPKRVARAVGSNFIPYNNVKYNANTMEFSTSSVNPRAVFGLLLAIDHHAGVAR